MSRAWEAWFALLCWGAEEAAVAADVAAEAVRAAAGSFGGASTKEVVEMSAETVREAAGAASANGLTMRAVVLSPLQPPPPLLPAGPAVDVGGCTAVVAADGAGS